MVVRIQAHSSCSFEVLQKTPGVVQNLDDEVAAADRDGALNATQVRTWQSTIGSHKQQLIELLESLEKPNGLDSTKLVQCLTRVRHASRDFQRELLDEVTIALSGGNRALWSSGVQKEILSHQKSAASSVIHAMTTIGVPLARCCVVTKDAVTKDVVVTLVGVMARVMYAPSVRFNTAAGGEFLSRAPLLTLRQMKSGSVSPMSMRCGPVKALGTLAPSRA